MSLIREKNTKDSLIEQDMSIMDERNLKSVKERKVKLPKVKTKITDILPIQDITSNGYFDLKGDSGYLEILQIGSKDIYSADESEKEDDITNLAYIYQAYPYDLKIVPMSFPVNTEIQKDYFRRLISKCKVKSYIPHLEEKLRELEYLESHKTNREYYLFVFADTEHHMKERVTVLKSLYSRSNPLSKLSDDKKIKILNKMYNMNTKINA